MQNIVPSGVNTQAASQLGILIINIIAVIILFNFATQKDKGEIKTSLYIQFVITFSSIVLGLLSILAFTAGILGLLLFQSWFYIIYLLPGIYFLISVIPLKVFIKDFDFALFYYKRFSTDTAKYWGLWSLPQQRIKKLKPKLEKIQELNFKQVILRWDEYAHSNFGFFGIPHYISIRSTYRDLLLLILKKRKEIGSDIPKLQCFVNELTIGINTLKEKRPDDKIRTFAIDQTEKRFGYVLEKKFWTEEILTNLKRENTNPFLSELYQWDIDACWEKPKEKSIENKSYTKLSKIVEKYENNSQENLSIITFVTSLTKFHKILENTKGTNVQIDQIRTYTYDQLKKDWNYYLKPVPLLLKEKEQMEVHLRLPKNLLESLNNFCFQHRLNKSETIPVGDFLQELLHLKNSNVKDDKSWIMIQKNKIKANYKFPFTSFLRDQIYVVEAQDQNNKLDFKTRKKSGETKQFLELFSKESTDSHADQTIKRENSIGGLFDQFYKLQKNPK